MQRLLFRILGPLEVEQDGQLLGIGGPKERAVLAVLLLHANEQVSAEFLIEALWGDAPPESARHTLAAYVSRLRKAFDGGKTEHGIEGRTGGYLLHLDPDQLDLNRFQGLLAAGKRALAAGDPSTATAELAAALRLWYGEPLADLATEPFAAAEIAWLDELRLSAVEAQIDSALALGRDAEAIGELKALVAHHELRETFRGQLMTALYRTGRQAEALEVYRNGRRLLVEQLGLEPSEQLQDLHRTILNHELPAPPTGPPVREAHNGPEDDSSPRRRRRRLRLAVPIVAVVAGLCGLSLALVLDGSGSTALVDGLATLDTRSGKVAQLASTPAAPGAVVKTGRWLWVTQPAEDSALKIDSRDGRVVHTVKISSEPGGMATAGGSVWLSGTDAGSVYRIDPQRAAVTQVVPVGGTPTAVASGFGSLWVVDQRNRSVDRIDPRLGRKTAVIHTGAAQGGLATGAGRVWVGDESSGNVVEIDPTSNRVVGRIAVGNGPAAVVAEEGAVWVSNRLDETVARIDPTTHAVAARAAVADAPGALLLDDGSLWVASDPSGTVTCMRSATDAPRSFVLHGEPVSLASAGDHLVFSVTRSR